MARITVVGEAMIELSTDAGGWRMGYGGDTLNTAIHLARFGEHVRYFTALGDDSFSGDLRVGWLREGIDPQLVLTATDASPGLYAIRTDAAGERSFSYWRGESAARRMFHLPETAAAVACAQDADLFAYSLISLAILPDEGREALIALAHRMKTAGRAVAFDGNYRPRLWRDAAEARTWCDRAIAACSIGLPTFDDERMMAGTRVAADTADRWRGLGASEVAVKLGAEGCLLDGGEVVAPPARLAPRDTSGAGDAFNAGYLHARCNKVSPTEAALAGHRLAGWVVMRSGALPAQDQAAPYAC